MLIRIKSGMKNWRNEWVNKWKKNPFWVNKTLALAQSSDPSATQTDYPFSLMWVGLNRWTGKDNFLRVPNSGFEPTTFVSALWWRNRKATLNWNKNFTFSWCIEDIQYVQCVERCFTTIPFVRITRFKLQFYNLINVSLINANCHGLSSIEFKMHVQWCKRAREKTIFFLNTFFVQEHYLPDKGICN